ncbi:MAG: hypothetical protein ACYS5V_09865 [Planctomycetota bacterium]
METPRTKRFCRSEAELEDARLGLKLLLCPHCGRVGFLISHGFAWGYAEAGPERVIRGRRFFCSNRYRRRGCGRTFSVLLADRLYGFVVGTRTLWQYLWAVFGGLSRKAAWAHVGAAFSLESGYRLWQRLSQAQTHIRARLCRHGPPPACSATHPLAQLVAHLRGVFPAADCPFAHFQSHFQTPLLP